MKVVKSLGIAVLMIGSFVACGDKTSKSDLASAANAGEAEPLPNEFEKDLDVGMQAIASKKYVDTVKDASDMDPMSFTAERLVVGTDDRGFSLYVRVNFKMNASPDRVVDKITYYTPLILVRPVTFELEVESLALSEESLRLDAACPLKLEDVQVLVTDALERANRAFKAR
jgi:hypothetical protein